MSEHFRSLIILQGDEPQIISQINYITKHIDGDWVTVSSSPILSDFNQYFFEPTQAKLLLGREFKHAVFNARDGFNLDAFAMLVGTLVAGSLLILVLPKDLNNWKDQDSLRWNEKSEAIRVPNFIKHLNQVIMQQQERYCHNISLISIDKLYGESYCYQFIKEKKLICNEEHFFYDDREQVERLNQLLSSNNDIILLTAKRGRGKSALAGMFSCYHSCWVTAPNKNAVTTLTKFATQNIHFFAPDELIIQLKISPTRPDWLIIDEAAMIPLPMIKTLLEQFNHVLLTSTTDGYEGTGQGLLLKLFEQYELTKKVGYYQLDKPIRWMDNDPLEYFTDNLIMTSHLYDLSTNINDKQEIVRLTQDELAASPVLLACFFSLLKTAHYRTTLIDLRRLFDAENLSLYYAKSSMNIDGVLVTIKEGGLDDELINDIRQGYRRPRGNLVAQSLAAHAGEKRAAKLHSIRINRIAVQERLRKQGVATKLIHKLIYDAQLIDCDFVSVSFAYSPDMCQFWAKRGFITVHIGSHQEASSGSYAIMAIHPISKESHILCNRMSKKLARNWYWQRKWVDIDLPIDVDMDQYLTQEDIFELSQFSTTFYSYTASLASLSRLACWINDSNQSENSQQMSLLLDLISNQFSEKIVVKKHGLSGKNELIKRLRKEVYQFMLSKGLFNE